MYFPGDPLFDQDPIFNSIPDPKARERLISRFDLGLTEPDWALGYEWDIVLRGQRGDRRSSSARRTTGDRGADPVADRRAVPGHRAAVAGRPVRGARGHRRGRSRSPGGCWTARAQPVPDALIETWQADPDGRFAHPDDPRGARRARHGVPRLRPLPDRRRTAATASSRSGPGALPSPDGGTEAPHLDVSVFARGLLDRVVTRIYFPDEAEANAADPVLAAIADPARRATLDRHRGRPAARRAEFRFDIRLQGEQETVFFDV